MRVQLLRFAGLSGLCVLLAVVVMPWQPTHAESTGFTLVGRADGGVPSGRRLVLGDTLVIVSDDSGAPVRFVIDLRWVRDRLPAIDQDDLLEIETQVMPDGTLVATSVVNVSDRSGTNNPGLSTGSQQQPEGPRARDSADNDQRDENTAPTSPTSTTTRAATPTTTASLTATPTGTASPTLSSTSTTTPTSTPTGTATPTPTATATPTPTPAADLALTKAVNKFLTGVGKTVTFTVTLTNGGPDTATGVQVTDLLPAGLAFVSATPSQGTYSSTTGLWTVGTVSPGTPQTLQILARVDSPSPSTNTARVSASDQADPNPGNNTASRTVLPQEADLALTKTVDNPTPGVGNVVSFTLLLTNNGPDNAANVEVTDLLPPGLTFLDSIEQVGSYDPVTGVWAIDIVGSGGTIRMDIDATVQSPGSFTNTATISANDQFDPNPANNTASVTVTPR